MSKAFKCTYGPLCVSEVTTEDQACAAMHEFAVSARRSETCVVIDGSVLTLLLGKNAVRRGVRLGPSSVGLRTPKSR